jgi:hypothetical protein
MRSIRYRLQGRPQNLDDCLHYARANPPRRISSSIGFIERIGELWLLRQFVLYLRWDFDNLQLCTESVLGGVFLHQSLRVQRGALGRANLRLSKLTSRIGAALPQMALELGRVDESTLFVPPGGQNHFSEGSGNG